MGVTAWPRRSGARRWIVGGLVALAVVAPWIGRGYVLSWDMVFVPHPALNARGLGLDGSVPRAVPGDFVVAVLNGIVPGAWLQLLILAGLLAAAVMGTWLLTPATTDYGRAAAAILYSWNAFVLERLLLGHWALLVGYAALPWAVRAARLWGISGRASPAMLGRFVLPVALAAWSSPAGGVIVAVTAVAVLAATGGGWRGVLAATGLVAVLNGPWWVPAVLLPHGLPGDPAGVVAFAARPDTPLGVVGSLLTFGGLWSANVAPLSRSLWPVALVAVVPVVVAAFGAAGVHRAWGRSGTALAGVAAAGVVLALVAHLPGGSELLRWSVVHVPVTGMLRDAQKWVMPFVLLVAVAFGPGVEAVAARFTRPWRGVLAGLLVVVPVAALPGLAWGAGGQLTATTWPNDWSAVATALEHDPARGDVAVVPWHLYRAWPWHGDRPVLDPFPRLTKRTVVLRDDLELADGSVRGEDRRAAALTRALGRGTVFATAARDLGIRFVVVDRQTAGGPFDVATQLPGATVLWSGPNLALYDLGPVSSPDSGRPPAAPIIVMDLLALVVAVLFVGALARARWSALLRWRRTQPQEPGQEPGREPSQEPAQGTE